MKEELENRGVETLIAPVAKISRAMLTPKGLVRFLLQVLSSLYGMRSALGGRRVDVVHSNTLAVLNGAVWAKMHRIEHVWHVHEIIEHPDMVRKCFPLMLSLFADKAVAISHAVADNLLRESPKLRNRITIIHNGMDPWGSANAQAVAAFRQHLGLDENDVLIALVGRINRWKGQLLFVQVAEILIGRGVKGVIFCIIGGPPPGQEHFRENLKAAVSTSAARSSLRILDFMEDIRVVWDACDIAVVPSTEPEPFGMVALEAMASAKPVVASRHGGLTEIVIPGETGFLFTPNVPQEFANALATLIADKALRISMGTAGRRRLEKSFRLDQYVRSFERLYEERI